MIQLIYYYLNFTDEPMGLKLETRKVYGSDTVALYGVGFLKPYLENKVTYALKATPSGLRAEIDSRSDTWFNGTQVNNKQTIYDLCRQTENEDHKYFICERRKTTTVTDDNRLIEDKAFGYYLMLEK